MKIADFSASLIPATIQELATKYTEGGGDRKALEDALKEAE